MNDDEMPTHVQYPVQSQTGTFPAPSLAYSQYEPGTIPLHPHTWRSVFATSTVVAVLGILAALTIVAMFAVSLSGHLQDTTTSPATTTTVEPSVTVPPATLPTVPDATPRLAGDALFVSIIQQDGSIEITDPSLATSYGHRICTFIAMGHTADDAVTEISTGAHFDSGGKVTHRQAQLLVRAAQAAYCPDEIN